MRTYRCPYPHPRIPGKPCNALLRIEFVGTIMVECPRCRRVRIIDFEHTYTSTLTVLPVHA